MSKSYYSLGLMSGTSADGVDASIIQSDGDAKYEVILDKYFKYNEAIYKSIHSFKDKINNSKDLKNLSKEIQPIEREITLFHVNAVNTIIKESKLNINFIGFHGQTIFHNAKIKISMYICRYGRLTYVLLFLKYGNSSECHLAPLLLRIGRLTSIN